VAAAPHQQRCPHRGRYCRVCPVHAARPGMDLVAHHKPTVGQRRVGRGHGLAGPEAAPPGVGALDPCAGGFSGGHDSYASVPAHAGDPPINAADSASSSHAGSTRRQAGRRGRCRSHARRADVGRSPRHVRPADPRHRPLQRYGGDRGHDRRRAPGSDPAGRVLAGQTDPAPRRFWPIGCGDG
jgi:hypothetical protein